MFLLGCWLLAGIPAAGETLSLSFTNANGMLELSWPGWATDGVLEHTTNVGRFPSWSTVSSALYLKDATGFHYRSSDVQASGYYRLRRIGSPVPGLAAYWNLDEAAGQVLPDGAGGANSLQVTNAVWAAGRIGTGCLRFNGQGLDAGGSLAWVSNANYQVLPPGGSPFSISLWFSPDAPIRSWQPLLGNDLDGTSGWHVGLNSPAPGTNYLVWTGTGNGSSLNLSAQTVLLPGSWHLLTLSYSSNQAALYLDNRLLILGTGSVTNPPSPLFFGAGSADRATFLGLIDEPRIYTTALSQEQVSITGQWYFDENSASLAADSSILGHPAAVVSPAMWSPGKTNSGVDLNGGQITIANDDNSILPPSGAPFSLSFWMLSHGLQTGRSGLIYCADALGYGWQMTVNVDALTQTWLEVTSTNLGGTLSLIAPLDLTNGVWTKMDLTYDGGQATIYVNGQKIKSDFGAIHATPGTLLFGGIPNTANFNGIVDELKIYGRERNASEIGPVALPVWQMALTNSTTDLLLQGSGPPGKLLTYSLLSAPNLGTVNYSPGLPIVSFKAGGQKGPDAFVYTVSDGEFISAPATAVVSVVEPHWLSPGGGTSSPLDGTSPQRAWAAGTAPALDDIWRTNNYYDCFFYSPGEFQTTGWNYPKRSSANPGCKHIGSGSEGPGSTTLKLVNTWENWNEGLIFGALPQAGDSDNFEVRNLVLDCNAQGNPKYAAGEPIWLRIPLTTTARVDSVTLHWSNTNIPGSSFKSGRPAAFNLGTRTAGPSGYITNTVGLTSTGQVDVVSVGTNTDEILLQLTRRADGVDLYGLAEMDIAGASVSLPQAMAVGGSASQLDSEHSFFQAFDGDRDTKWASGPESQVQITLPLDAGTPVSQVNFSWNCQTLSNLSRLGPAASYVIYARDEKSGQLWPVPFVSHGRDSNGLACASFGTTDLTNSIVTDQLTILLTSREQGVTYYSLRELSLQNGPYPTPLRMPTATSTLAWDITHSILKVFDGDLNSAWVSGTQGSVAAIGVRGSNMKFSGLKVIHFGTKAGRECFAVSVFASDYSPPLRNILVEDCIITEPATNNSDGLTAFAIIGQSSGRLLNTTVRRCTVSGVRPWFSYSHGFGAGCIENCRVDDCEVGVYFEPNPEGFDSPGPVVVRSNQFVNVVFGISVDFHPRAHFESLLCAGNEIVLDSATPQGFGIRFCDNCLPGPSGTITNLLILNNVIRYSGWATPSGSVPGGLMYSDIHHAVYANNLVALGNPNCLRVRGYPGGVVPAKPPDETCDNPGFFPPGPSTFPPSVDALLPGYRRAWLNNRDLSGFLLPVRYYQWGIDGLASQQQWPE